MNKMTALGNLDSVMLSMLATLWQEVGEVKLALGQGWAITFLGGPHCQNGHGYWAEY